jgi:hypothetical protein
LINAVDDIKSASRNYLALLEESRFPAKRGLCAEFNICAE